MATLSSRSLSLTTLPLNIPVPLAATNYGALSKDESAFGERDTSPRLTATDEGSEARSSPVSSMQADSVIKDDDDDQLSCCSDDSELSVGKEDGVDSEPLNQIGEPAKEDGANVDGTNVELRIKLPIIRPSPTFLKSSQLYAEELMRHQMSMVAAARGLSLSPNCVKNNSLTFDIRPGSSSPIREGFRPHIRQMDKINRTSLSPDIVNYSGIHSHLNAISKITNAISSHDIQKITSPASSTSRESSQSPSGNVQLQHLQNAVQNQPHQHHHHLHHHHHHLPLHNHQVINNNLNESSLKFSIDNILKADFGRRITEPLKRTKSQSRKSHRASAAAIAAATAAAATKAAAAATAATAAAAAAAATASQQILSGTPASANNSDIVGVDVGAVDKPSVPSPMDLTAILPVASDKMGIPESPLSSQARATSPAATSTGSESGGVRSSSSSSTSADGPMVWPAWVYCTRYSDRPSSGRSKYNLKRKTVGKIDDEQGPRTRRPKKSPGEKGIPTPDEKRPRTAFSGPQLSRLKHEFNENRYLTERRRQQLSAELGLNEAQIKIWFQNKRAKIKKASGTKNPLALQLMAQGLYNHTTVPLTREEEEMQEMQANAKA